ncbi:unnamed protein product [Linum tenue]|uniref:Transposase n=1 Tax=Linum tenue TaxID=586396 RepID=A0AAV0HUH7_9ROSI|nr:unnamed protein product [Linum tenue]
MISLLSEKLPVESLLLGGMMIHVRCSAHILNLIVREGLKVIGGAIEKIRKSVHFWLGTPKRWEKFQQTANQMKMKIGKKLILDCETRWNSTYMMLDIAKKYKDVFAKLKNRDPLYKCVPSESEWNMTEVICDKLKIFYQATLVFSGTKYPTANLFFPIICEIKLALKQWADCGIDIIESMSLEMIEKYDKYWSEVHLVMGVAVVLDPRYKAEVFQCYFPKIYLENSKFERDKIVGLCRQLLVEYEQKDREEEQVNNDKGNVEAAASSQTSFALTFDTYASQKKRKQPERSELDAYLDKDIVRNGADLDVLAWWKSNMGKYPILHKVARDFLCIPVSTVASESAFSTSGRVISPHRSRLSPQTIEALMCAQNWLFAKSTEVGPQSKDHSDSEEELEPGGQN